MNIKEIVFFHINSLNGNVNVQNLTEEIRAKHPSSKWDHTHWNYYRSQITSDRGRYSHLFSDEIRNNLKNISYDVVNRKPLVKSKLANASTGKSTRDQWPNWDVPTDEEQIALGRVILPYIKILDPKIVQLIVEDNNKNLSIWQEQLESLGIRSDIYLWENSPVAFPGIRRHVGTHETAAFKANPRTCKGVNAIFLDANSYPKEVWSYALRNIRYGNTNPANYSLAHILDHKDYKTRNTNELKGFQITDDQNLFAGLYTSCANTIYIPTTYLKPTDHNSKVRQLLIQIVDRYYGSICRVLPHNLSFNLDEIEEHWRLDNFSPPSIVGKTDNVHNFIVYRNNVINRRIKELLEERKK